MYLTLHLQKSDGGGGYINRLFSLFSVTFMLQNSHKGYINHLLSLFSVTFKRWKSHQGYINHLLSLFSVTFRLQSSHKGYINRLFSLFYVTFKCWKESSPYQRMALHVHSDFPAGPTCALLVRIYHAQLILTGNLFSNLIVSVKYTVCCCFCKISRNRCGCLHSLLCMKIIDICNESHVAKSTLSCRGNVSS